MFDTTFVLGTLTKGQPYSIEKIYFSLGLEFDENLNRNLIEFDSNPRLHHD
jgi:hypothetical protein